MNKQQLLQRDIRILEDKVEMIKDSKRDWMATSIAFGLILVMLSVFLFIYPEEMGVYKQGFQDGQANCKGINDYHYDLKCYIPLESGNYSVDNEGIIHTPSGRNIKCDEVRR